MRHPCTTGPPPDSDALAASSTRKRDQKGSTQVTEWKRLDLTDKQIEVLAHMTLKPDADSTELVVDVWPGLSLAAGLAQLDSAVESINAAASAATGKLGPVVLTGSPDSGVSTPEMRVLVLGVPCVEVR